MRRLLLEGLFDGVRPDSRWKTPLIWIMKKSKVEGEYEGGERRRGVASQSTTVAPKSEVNNQEYSGLVPGLCGSSVALD
jgi:hypothetical protein